MVKVLVVDNNVIIADRIGSCLREQGYVIRVENDGKAGWEAIEDIQPDLVITEISLPGMDGFELIRKLRNNYPEIKVIVMSSRAIISAFEYLKVARSLGIEFSILKPFREEYLRLIVKRLLDYGDKLHFRSEPLQSA